ncbi:DNA clamp loader [Pilobolus umbonatus]|nr:DNA clamp loader [Pilobolus umbonatus]
MSLWVDKYKPKSLDQLSYHKQLTKQLKNLAQSENFPHILLHGPSGAGKQTRITAILKELYGPGVEKIKVEQCQFVVNSSRKLMFGIVTSNYHMELNPSDLGIYDRVVIQDIIKNAAQTQQVNANTKHQFKVVVINQADKLTKEAQSALRRTMEKHTKSMRLILCCENLGKIMAPIKSRCLLVRVPRPQVKEITKDLHTIAKTEGFELGDSLATQIATFSERDMRNAILTLERTAIHSGSLANITKPDLLSWQIQLHSIADSILKEQNPALLGRIRKQLFQMLSKCLDPTIIIKEITSCIIKCVDDESLKTDILAAAAYHQHRLHLGAKTIIHLEAFISKVMSIYKR